MKTKAVVHGIMPHTADPEGFVLAPWVRALTLRAHYGRVWVAREAGPSPAYVRRQYRRHPEVRRAASVYVREVRA